MTRVSKLPVAKRRQIGAKVSVELWKQMRMLALEQGRDATQLLDEAMAEYIKKHKKEK